MKKMILNIMATTGITLVILAFVATCYGGTLICISTVFQALVLNIVIYVGIYLLNRFEFCYPIFESGLKLIYVLSLVLISGWCFEWYNNLSGPVLILMTVAIFVVCIYLDAISLISEVKAINGLIEDDKDFYGEKKCQVKKNL